MGLRDNFEDGYDIMDSYSDNSNEFDTENFVISSEDIRDILIENKRLDTDEPVMVGDDELAMVIALAQDEFYTIMKNGLASLV